MIADNSQEQCSPTSKAEKVMAGLKSTGKFPAAKIWVGGSKARVYTGHKSEYLEVGQDLKVSKSKLNLTWGQLIDPVIATV